MDVKLPNGKIITGVPEGTSKEAIKAKAISSGVATEADFGVSTNKATQAPQEVPQEALQEVPQEALQEVPQAMNPPRQAPQELSLMDKIGLGLGSPLLRVVKGAIVDPLLGINQILGGRAIAKYTGQSDIVNDYDKATQDARTRVSGEADPGFDFFQLAGSAISPINRLAAPANVGANIALTAAKTGALQGVVAPVVGKDESDSSFLSSKLIQTGLGSLLGAAVPAALLGSSKFGKFVSELPVTAEARTRAVFKYFEGLVGKDKEEFIRLARTTEEIVPGSKPTMSTVVSDTTKGIPLIKEQERLASEVSTAPIFKKIEQEAAAARMAELNKISGGPGAIQGAQQVRTEITDEMREAALKDANRFATEVIPAQETLRSAQGAQNKALQMQGRADTETAQALNRASLQPGSRGLPFRYSANTERALEYQQTAKEIGTVLEQKKAITELAKESFKSVSEKGYYPLLVNPLQTVINKIKTTPGSQSNEMLQASLKGLETRLAAYSDEKGIINSVDLVNIRKEIASDIGSFMKDKNNPSLAAQAVKVEKSIKGIIDGAIDKAAGNNVWSNYLKTFATHSKKINQMQIGEALQQKLGGNVGDLEKMGSFAQSVKDSSSLIKRETGMSRYTKLGQVLTLEQMASVDKVTADISRKIKANALGTGVKGSTGMDTEGTPVKVLSTAVVVLNSAMQWLKKGSQAEFDVKVATLLANPQAWAIFMETMSKKDAPIIASAIMARLSPVMKKKVSSIFEGAVDSGAFSLNQYMKAGTGYESGALLKVGGGALGVQTGKMLTSTEE